MKKTLMSLDELRALACNEASSAKKHQHRKIGLVGPLGAGKTTFTKEFAKGLGINKSVSSPTFTLMQEYCGINNKKLLHIDLYRFDKNDKETLEQIKEKISSSPIVLIEWADLSSEILNILDRVYYFSHSDSENMRWVEAK